MLRLGESLDAALQLVDDAASSPAPVVLAGDVDYILPAALLSDFERLVCCSLVEVLHDDEDGACVRRPTLVCLSFHSFVRACVRVCVRSFALR